MNIQSADKTPDNELVDRFVNKSDVDAFETIYRRYVSAVYRSVYIKVGKKEWAEDIVSETFMLLMDILSNYRGESSLKTFITGIAFNKVRQFWQKQQHDGISFDEAYVYAEEESEEPEEMSDELPRLVAEVLKTIGAPYNLVLEKRFIEGCSIAETASQLNLSSENVRVIQHRAIKKAKEYYENQNGK
ncbi:MAG: sigma-70 family RNA polymerase sigma factor [Candidatus Dojkabacteria bacterium]|uniref:RNA polymerase sigma factor SigX n=2 Tax=Candidatus Dojkabacteria TaxID=74243 RepID=A0A136KG81_9BACT|nr:MAG: RNA polymerase sigma factor SigX [candidate division WS6 bacterium OLB21]MBW7953825.1 sigma-70 family RNA polymerase sigma factor [Candidatus Dojkabacteria bacterium]WKZ27673.1 MAG: sigma-70 family RNA polymerase sigma factor [Candidatus Dojkabacteria bacterium]